MFWFALGAAAFVAGVVFAAWLDGLTFLLVLSLYALAAFLVTLFVQSEDDMRRAATDNPYVIAYLRGGHGAVVRCALAALQRQGRISVDGSAPDRTEVGLVAEPPPSDASDPRAVWLEAHIEHALANGPLTIDALITALGDQTTQLGQTLERAGLVYSDRQLSNRRWAVRAPFMIVLAIGLSKLFIGLSRDKPVIILLVVVIGLLALVVSLGRSLSARTPMGQRLLDHVTRAYSAIALTAKSAPAMLSNDQVRLAVATFGAAALGPEFALLERAAPVAAQAASGDGGSSSGCGSGCGGCGGCGGCS